MKKVMITGAVAVAAIVGYLGISPIVTSKIVEENFSTVTTNIAKEANIELKDFSYQSSLTGATAYRFIPKRTEVVAWRPLTLKAH
jgi:hypothetical protein